MSKVYDISLGMDKKEVVKTGIVLCQGDYGMTFKITITGQDLDNVSQQIVFRKTDNKVIEGIPTIVDGALSYEIKGNELSCPGMTYADVKLLYENGRESTATFTFKVVGDTLNATPIESGAYSESLDNAIKEALDAAQEARDAVQNGGGGGGGNGTDGFSPVAKVTTVSNGVEIEITDKKGTTKATVLNGSKGDKGDPGEPGTTADVITNESDTTSGDKTWSAKVINDKFTQLNTDLKEIIKTKHSVTKSFGKEVHKFNAYDTSVIATNNQSKLIQQNTIDYCRSKYSMKLTKSEITAISFMSYFDINITIDPSKTYGLWLYISKEDENKIDGIEFSFASAYSYGWFPSTSCVFSYTGTHLVYGWNYIPFTGSWIEGVTNYKALRIQLRTISATDIISVYLDSIVENYKMKATVLLCFDDCTLSNLYNVSYKLLKSRGLCGTFAYGLGATPDDGVSVTMDKLKEMQSYGWGVAQYGGMTDTLSQNRQSIIQYNNLLKSKGVNPEVFFCRYNESTSDIISAAQEIKLKAVRTTSSKGLIVGYDKMSYEIPSTSISTTVTFDGTIKAKIDEAISGNYCISILAHQVLESPGTNSYNVSTADYTAMLDYIVTKITSGQLSALSYSDFIDAVERDDFVSKLNLS